MPPSEERKAPGAWWPRSVGPVDWESVRGVFLTLARFPVGCSSRRWPRPRWLSSKEKRRLFMHFSKQVLYEFNMPYALGWMEKDGQRCIVGATEDHGPI